jgi:hypothetical protein
LGIVSSVSGIIQFYIRIYLEKNWIRTTLQPLTFTTGKNIEIGSLPRTRTLGIVLSTLQNDSNRKDKVSKLKLNLSTFFLNLKYFKQKVTKLL